MTSRLRGVEGIEVRDRRGRRLGTLSVGGVLGWLAVTGPVAVVVHTTIAVTPDGPRWPAVVVLVLAVAAADLPDSGAGLLVLGAVGAWWVAVVRDAPPAATALVAGALLVHHLALCLAALGPPGRVVTRRVVAGLAARGCGVLVATGVVGLAAALTAGRVDLPIAATALVLLALAALPWWATRR